MARPRTVTNKEILAAIHSRQDKHDNLHGPTGLRQLAREIEEMTDKSISPQHLTVRVRELIEEALVDGLWLWTCPSCGYQDNATPATNGNGHCLECHQWFVMDTVDAELSYPSLHPTKAGNEQILEGTGEARG